jgi:hypothetical protein
MTDVFLMGTIGVSGWREPVKEACASAGVSCFDPIVPEWNEEARQREISALETAKVIVMAILPDTASIASLAESGWAAMSALKRGQKFGIYIDPDVHDLDTTSTRSLGGLMLDVFFGGRRPNDSVEDASKRARQLVLGHMSALLSDYPDPRLYSASSLEDLRAWAIRTVKTLSA